MDPIDNFIEKVREFENLLENATIDELKTMIGTLKFEIRQKKYTIQRIEHEIKKKENNV